MNVLVNTATTRNVVVNTATGRQSAWISCKAGVGLVMVLICSDVQDMLCVHMQVEMKRNAARDVLKDTVTGRQCAWLRCRGGACKTVLCKTSCVHI